MLLIWGFKVMHKVLSQHHFHCPKEGADRDCELVAARRWFTFFFIPMIPLKELGQFVRCSSCQATYDPQILSAPTNAQIQDNLTTALRHVVVAMLRADDTVDDAERAAALQVMADFGAPGYDTAALDADLESLDVNALEVEMAQIAGTLTAQGHESVVRACLALAAADGHVDDREVETIIAAGRGLGMSPAHIRGILAEINQQAHE